MDEILRPIEVLSVTTEAAAALGATALIEQQTPVTTEVNTEPALISGLVPPEVLEPTERYIPSLFGRMYRATSYHPHKYDDSITVKAQHSLIWQKVKTDGLRSLTDGENQLVDDVMTIGRFTGQSKLYQFVYTPEEIHELAARLSALESKDRPEFGGVEDQILDVCTALLRGRPVEMTAEQRSLRGIMQRAERGDSRRRGMTFDTMNRFASIGSELLVANMHGEDRQEYLIRVHDPNPTDTLNLSAVYQFVADNFARDVFITRERIARQGTLAAFEANCNIIDAYLDEVAPMLEELPSDVIIEQKIRHPRYPTRDPVVRKHRPLVHLRNLQESMHKRRQLGEHLDGYVRGYKLDSMAAYKLQRLIGYVIESVNDTMVDTSDPRHIQPLESLDLDFD